MRPRQFLKVSVLRPYYPGGILNAFAPALHTHVGYATHSMQRLQLGLQGSLATSLKFLSRRIVSNPFCSPSFRSWPSDPFWTSAFAIGSLPRIITFYRSPWHTLVPSRSLNKEYQLLTVMLSITISQKTFSFGYERFRPNNRGLHSWLWCYRGGWHQYYPPLIR